MRFPHLAHRSAAAHKLHSTPQQDRMNLISGNLETSSRLPVFSFFLPGSCPINRDRRNDPISHRSLIHQAGEAPQVNSQALLGIVLFCLGYPNQALARSRAAINEARTLAHPPSLASSLSNGAVVLWLLGNSAVLDEWVDQLVAIATEQGFPYWRARGTIYRGWVKVKNGDVPEGVSLLRSGSVAYGATGANPGMDNIALLARACEITGQIEEAMMLLDDALQIVERTGERWFAAEVNRRKGQLLQRQGHSEAAQELYRKALSIAEEQGPSSGNCAPPRASPGSAATRAAAPKPAVFLRRSTAGLPKGSTHPISKTRRRCSTSLIKFRA